MDDRSDVQNGNEETLLWTNCERKVDDKKRRYHNVTCVSMDEIRECLDQPIVEVANQFGISKSLMKKICRHYGIKRWPRRKILALKKNIFSLETAMTKSKGVVHEQYRQQIAVLKLKLDELMAHPEKVTSKLPKNPPQRLLKRALPRLDLLRKRIISHEAIMVSTNRVTTREVYPEPINTLDARSMIRKPLQGRKKQLIVTEDEYFRYRSDNYYTADPSQEEIYHV